MTLIYGVIWRHNATMRIEIMLCKADYLVIGNKDTMHCNQWNPSQKVILKIAFEQEKKTLQQLLLSIDSRDRVVVIPTSCAHKWGQYIPALITTPSSRNTQLRFPFCSHMLHRWEFFKKKNDFFSKSSGNPISSQIFGHQRAENEARNTKMYRGQETHPIRINARYEMNWANSFFFKKFQEPHFRSNIWPPEGRKWG